MDTDNKVQGEPWGTDVRGLKNNGYDLDPNMRFFFWWNFRLTKYTERGFEVSKPWYRAGI